MIDIYPTTLEILGYELSGSRANLGVSLLGNSETLISEFGKTNLNRSISANTMLQRALWKQADDTVSN